MAHGCCLTCQSAIHRQILIGESQTPAKSCRTRPSKVALQYASGGSRRRRPGLTMRLRSIETRAEYNLSAHRAAPELLVSRVHDARPNPRPTDDEPTYLGTHVLEPGTQLLAPALAAEDARSTRRRRTQVVSSFAALATCGSAAAPMNCGGLCEPAPRVVHGWYAGALLLESWCHRECTMAGERPTATRQMMTHGSNAVAAICYMHCPPNLQACNSSPLQPGHGFFSALRILRPNTARFAVICAQIAYTYRHTASGATANKRTRLPPCTHTHWTTCLNCCSKQQQQRHQIAENKEVRSSEQKSIKKGAKKKNLAPPRLTGACAREQASPRATDRPGDAAAGAGPLRFPA